MTHYDRISDSNTIYTTQLYNIYNMLYVVHEIRVLHKVCVHGWNIFNVQMEVFYKRQISGVVVGIFDSSR